MGLLDLIKGALKRKARERFKGQKYECPSCKKQITIDGDRCPNCGTHIESMFRVKCPGCGENNSIDAVACEKCGRSFIKEQERGARKQVYVCPRCGYRADYFMTRCPACNVRFI